MNKQIKTDNRKLSTKEFIKVTKGYDGEVVDIHVDGLLDMKRLEATNLIPESCIYLFDALTIVAEAAKEVMDGIMKSADVLMLYADERIAYAQENDPADNTAMIALMSADVAINYTNRLTKMAKMADKILGQTIENMQELMDLNTEGGNPNGSQKS